MIKPNISFDKAMENVLHFTTPNKKGKTELDKMNVGFTCYANSVKVLKWYVHNGEYSVPTKAKAAQELLDKIK